MESVFVTVCQSSVMMSAKWVTENVRLRSGGASRASDATACAIPFSDSPTAVIASVPGPGTSLFLSLNRLALPDWLPVMTEQLFLCNHFAYVGRLEG